MAKSTVQKRRVQLLAGRDYAECHYCGCRIPKQDVTVDHVKPKALGGTNYIGNLVVACRTCNRMKGQMKYDLFLSQCRAIARSVA